MAYQAEIQIGVKGIRDLRNAQARIERLSRQVNEVNKKPLFNTAVVANLNTYNTVLAKANKTLAKTQIELDSAGNAVNDYKKAITNVVKAQADANEAKSITNNLLAQEARNLGLATEKLKAYNAAAVPARQVGSMAGAYLRPGESRLRGQTSAVNPQAAVEAEKDLQAVRQNLQKLDEASIRAHNARLDLQADYLVVLQRTADAARFRAQQPAAQLALPAFQERGLQLLDDAVKANESQLRIERSLNGERSRGVRFLEKQAEEERRQLSLGITGQRTNQLPANPLRQQQDLAIAAAKRTEQLAVAQRIERENLAVAERIRNVSASTVTQFNLRLNVLEQIAAIGRQINDSTEQEIRNQRRLNRELKVRKGREAQRRRKEAVGSALIGGGFPLLFGQGPGAALGGALGGGAGGLIGGQFGFGLSLIGTQLGATIDQFIQSTTELGQALNPLTADLDALAAAAGFAGTETAAAIQTIKQLGSEQQALEAATLLLAATVGQDGVNALRDFGDDTADLGREFARTMSLMQAAAAGFFGGVASFVSNVLEQANDLAVGLNLDTPEAKKLQKRRTEILQGSATSAFGAPGSVASSSIINNSGELTKNENRLRELARERRLEAEGIVLSQAQELKDKAFLEKFGLKSVALTKVENQLAAQKRDFTNDNYVSLLKQEALEQRNLANTRAISEAEKDKNGQIKNYRLLAEVTNQNEIAYNNTLLDIDRQRDKALDRRSKKQARLSQQGLKEQQTALDLVQRLKAQDQITAVGSGPEAQRLQIQNQYLRTLETISRLKNQDYTAELQALALSIRNNAEANLQAKLERDRAAALQQAVAPLVSIRDQQIQSIEKTKEYNRLIAEGVLPSEAKRIAAFNTQATLLVKQVEEKIKLVEVELLSLDANDAKTKALKRQLQLFKDQKKAIEGEASKGPGKGAPEETPADIIREQIGTLQEELDAMTNLGNVAVNVANSIGGAFSTAFQEVVSGSKSVQEGLADMFKTVAADFLKMAADIIAKQLMMIALQALLKALGAPVGGGGGGTTPPVTMPDAVALTAAEGAFVTGPTRALVGEGGEPEYVIPESKMRESMARYSRGARGGSVIPESGGSGTSGEGGGTAVAAPIDVRYTIERINSVDYVTADQFQAGLRQAADQGAKQGEQKTLKRLQMSSSTRKRLGM